MIKFGKNRDCFEARRAPGMSVKRERRKGRTGNQYEREEEGLDNDHSLENVLLV